MASQNYSITNCLVEAAYKLRATPGSAPENKQAREVGKALLRAELLSFRQLTKDEKQKGTQGLQVRLGFYKMQDLKTVRDHEDAAAEQIAYAIGGYLHGFQLGLEMLDDPGIWHGVSWDWPEATQSRHLDLGVQIKPDRCLVTATPGQRMIIARRLRYRLGLDFNGGSKTAFWWTTPQTESWIAQLKGEPENLPLSAALRRSFNYDFTNWLHHLTQQGCSGDPLIWNADDWGVIDLEGDPVNITLVGPRSPNAPTHEDVRKILDRAGQQITRSPCHLDAYEPTNGFPLEGIAAHLRRIAETPRNHRERDIVIIYRGGGLKEYIGPQAARFQVVGKYIDEQSRTELAQAIDCLTNAGTEVVLGIGHGDSGVFSSLGRKPPVGVYEAITPTAAAAWILKEHVNNQLVEAIVDPGQ